MTNLKQMIIPIEEILGSKAKVKILNLLVSRNELNITQIIKETKLNHRCVEPHLKQFESIGLIKEKKFGRIRIYNYSNNSEIAKKLKTFFIGLESLKSN